MNTRTKVSVFLAALAIAGVLALVYIARAQSSSSTGQEPAAAPAGAQAGRPPGELLVVEHNGDEYRFRWAPPGSFMMGSPKSEQKEVYKTAQKRIKAAIKETEEISNPATDKLIKDLKAQQGDPDKEFRNNLSAREALHQVTLTQGFWLLETEVTQAMWESIMGDNPSHFKGADLPVESVSWDDCQEFMAKFDDLELSPAGYSCAFPTEAQWEYACRAGTKTAFFWGDALNGDAANCNGEFPYRTKKTGQNLGQTSAVGSYAANPWGLLDMHGNVAEMCEGDYGDYPTEPVTDPRDPLAGRRSLTGPNCVKRGGAWNEDATYCRSAKRQPYGNLRFPGVGFRFALVPYAEEQLQGAETPEEE